jgi:hypothetical protein
MHQPASDRCWPFSASAGASLSVCFWGMQGQVCYQYEATVPKLSRLFYIWIDCCEDATSIATISTVQVSGEFN